uniref:Centrosomal protein 57, like 1 n=1 Tax=Oryzias sinensis TaxID=183150 RepID=A0A8C7Y2J8_9TELE
LDSPSKNSYIGSYYQPPERILSVSRELQFPAHSAVSADQTESHSSQTTLILPSGVVDALKNLQDKIRRLELERMQTQKTYLQVSHDAQKQPQILTSETAANLDLKLQSAESRCKILEKQLEYMRKMVENAKKDRSAVLENQASLQNQQTSNLNHQTQQEKLEKIESECLKLSRTQTLAETKLAILEQKLLQEEHERKLMQEKAEEVSQCIEHQELVRHIEATQSAQQKQELQRGLERLEGRMEEKEAQITKLRKHQQQVHESIPTETKGLQYNKKYVYLSSAKYYQYCRFLKFQTQNENKHELKVQIKQKEFYMIPPLFTTPYVVHLFYFFPTLVGKNVGNLHFCLPPQIHKLTQSQSHAEDHTAKKRFVTKPPGPSPVKVKPTAKSPTRNNLQLLRETKKLRSCLKQDDISWET